MKEWLIDLLKKIHSHLPLWLSNLYMPPVYFIRNMQTFFLQTYLIEGEERESGTRLKIAFFGKDPRILNYWAGILFRGNPVITKSSKIVVWKIGIYARHNMEKLDLVIVEITKLTKPFILSSGKGFVLPRWFDTLIDVEKSLFAIAKNDTQKQINKYGFTCEEKFTTDDLKFFYERMFKPYISSRHKESSVMVDFSYFLKRFRKKDSRLFFLMKDKEPVAASFNERKNGMIKFSGLGILDAKREILTMGAIRVLYFFMLSYYKEKKVEEINFGGTSPLLSDGLTQFKFSMRAFPNKKKLFGEKSLWVLPVNKANAIHDVLKSNPFIYITQKEIYRAIFLDSKELNNKHEFMQLIKRIRYDKMDGTKIFCLNDTENISQWIKEEAIPNHDVIKL